MAKLTARRRKALPDSKFGLPEQKAYPIDTAARARNAKARAAQQLKAGNLSRAEKAKIDRRADAVIKKARRRQ